MSAQFSVTYAIQFPIYLSPEQAEGDLVLRIDPRNYFEPLAMQLAMYKKNPQALGAGVAWARSCLQPIGGKLKYHSTLMCPSTTTGARFCFPTCPHIHHLPLYYALNANWAEPAKQQPAPQPKMIESPKPLVQPKLDGLEQVKSGLPFYPNFQSPLKIDEHVPQPITELNAETDEEEAVLKSISKLIEENDHPD